MIQNKMLEIIEATIRALTDFSEQNSCIIATASLINTMNLIEPGHKISPLTVEATIYNPKQSKQFLAKEPLTGDMRVIGHRSSISDKNNWAGHLIAMIPTPTNKQHLLDIAITSVSSGKDDVNLQPIIIGVTKNFVQSDERIGLSINNSYVIYKPYPQDLSYKDSPLWNDQEYKDNITKQTLRYLA